MAADGGGTPAVDIQIIPAEAAHVAPIAERMRVADRDEVFAASGRTPADALAYSLRRSALARTALIDGTPEVMFGVGDLNVLLRIGAPWLLGTDTIERHQTAFLRRSVEWRGLLLGRYSKLTNVVDDRNEASKRWLEWLGFRLSGPVQLLDQQWRIFELRAEDVRHRNGIDPGLDAVGRGRADAAGERERAGRPI